MVSHDARKIRLIMRLRQSGILDTHILSALERVPRDYFVTESMQDQAWEDIALPIACGQTISQPYVVAHMTQALDLDDRCKVLEIGTGSGYQTCVLAQLCRRVYTIERHRPLFEGSARVFKELAVRNVTNLCADGMQGWPTINGQTQAPFDRILVTAAARNKPPQTLLDQLAVGGIMIIPVGEPGFQVLKKYVRESDEVISIQDLFDVRFVPLLPDVEEAQHAVA